MHKLIECGRIKEIRGTQCLSYILEDNALFNLSEYKIIHNQETSQFIESARSKLNGKIKLTYFTADYVSLKSLAPAMESYPFISVLANVIGNVLEVTDNGYLDIDDLLLDTNRIYVNPNSLEAKLIYLPLNDFDDGGTSVLKASPLEEFRINLVKLISATPNIISARTNEICSWLSDSSVTLEAINAGIRLENPKAERLRPVTKNATMIIRSVDAPKMLEFRINQSAFSIGRTAAQADGCVGFNPAISGLHCRIYKTASGFEIEDLSRNGTYINKARIKSGTRAALRNGDTLHLANSEFSVSIIEG